MRGRKAKPTQLKVIQGNPGKKRLPENEPTPDVVQGVEIPEGLDAVGQRVWEQYCPVLEKTRVLTEADLLALENLCHAQSDIAAANADIAVNGIKADDGRKNSAVTVKHSALQQVRMYLVELGLTPSSRTRVKTVPKAKADPLGDFLDAKKKG